uniref:NADH dehydrogenase subunit 5 n=1 Tax=Skeletonema subsalsum TaxID=216763 RepID=UPI001D10BFBE|nr:NADH dehydrogenase subunit 5 [Skeletonema subsalsum]YP_010208950.1 NADH dehydrogenase subunit 5 [Skeletonema potamos]UBA16221.1 NADH dehydrogenase subunit 5 [Skeletonema subsalsum]UBA16260.1 NADH dehydrogenase subunit 5 [Skeletonema potamos]
MYLLLVFLPLIGSCCAGLFGRKLGPYGASCITVTCLLITFFLSLFAFYEVSLLGCCVYIKFVPWINSELLNIDWGFLFDSLTVVMCCVVTFVSSIVHLYSTEYMAHDPHLPRFMSYLSLFTFFMLILVTADNFIQMFVGWEGVGLCSYLLINFWFTRIQANKAAIKAMVLNRIGDFGLVIGILIIFVEYKAVDYATVFAVTPIFTNKVFSFLSFDFDLISIICFFLFIGAVGKSAQLGLHTWLPDAMEGPTPVSALIHAATMVTAGVFLIARTSPLFEYTSSVLSLVTIVGACTAFFAATVGLLQNDLKRVIAYSTCSQLGYMVFACGLSNYSVGVFHLVNHAFFKALLFLGAGSIIHAVADEQDMRKMGGLKKLVPFTYSMMVIGSLALIGFPFLTGFYSKDVILEVAYGKYTLEGHFSYILGTIGAFLTAFYSTRLVYLTFLCRPNGYKPVISKAYDSSYQICISLFLLVVPSVLIGFYAKDMIIGFGSDFWGNAIFTTTENMNRIDSEFITHIYKILPVILSLSGATLSFLLYSFGSKLLVQLKLSVLGKKIYHFFNKKWFFDKVYNEYIGQFFFTISYTITYKIIDRGIVEIFGPMGLSSIITKKATYIAKMQTGYLYHYTFLILTGLTLILGLRQFWTFAGSFTDFKIFILFFILSFFLSNKKT